MTKFKEFEKEFKALLVKYTGSDKLQNECIGCECPAGTNLQNCECHLSDDYCITIDGVQHSILGNMEDD